MQARLSSVGENSLGYLIGEYRDFVFVLGRHGCGCRLRKGYKWPENAFIKARPASTDQETERGSVPGTSRGCRKDRLAGPQAALAPSSLR